MRTLVKSLLFSVALPIFSYSGAAYACGAFFPPADATISMEAQRAVYHIKEDRVEVVLQVTGANASSAFAWVIPVPADDTIDLSVTTNALFDELDQFTTPEVTITGPTDDEGGCGCGSAADRGADLGTPNGIDVFKVGKAGNYDYAIIGGTEGEQIATWLTDNGFAVPANIASALEQYSNAGLRFVAVKFAEDVVNSSAFGSEPLVIDMARPDMIVYPLGITRVSAVDAIPVVLYVLADQRYKTSYTNLDLNALATKMRATFDRDGSVPTYVDAVDAATSEADGRLFVTDFAQDVTSQTCSSCTTLNARIGAGAYLTRMYGNVPADKLLDVALTTSADADVSNYQYAQRALMHQLAHGLAPIFLFFGWLRLQAVLRRRR